MRHLFRFLFLLVPFAIWAQPMTLRDPGHTDMVNTLDADAASFFARVGPLTATEESAVNQLVLSLKASGLWAKLDAVYPFVGSSATGCSYNLRNTATFRITWGNSLSWTFNSSGAKGDGASTYGDTHWVPASATGSPYVSTYNSMSTFAYMVTQPGDNQCLLGCLHSTTPWNGAWILSYVHPANAPPNATFQMGEVANPGPGAFTSGNFKGPILVGRASSTHTYLYNQFHNPDGDGGNSQDNDAVAEPDLDLLIGAQNYDAPNGGPWYWTSATFGAFAMGQSMHSRTDWDNLVAIFDAFATALGRYAR